jgi:hypothetical protein
MPSLINDPIYRSMFESFLELCVCNNYSGNSGVCELADVWLFFSLLASC